MPKSSSAQEEVLNAHKEHSANYSSISPLSLPFEGEATNITIPTPLKSNNSLPGKGGQ